MNVKSGYKRIYCMSSIMGLSEKQMWMYTLGPEQYLHTETISQSHSQVKKCVYVSHTHTLKTHAKLTLKLFFGMFLKMMAL